jgi:hypothetical protein
MLEPSVSGDDGASSMVDSWQCQARESVLYFRFTRPSMTRTVCIVSSSLDVLLKDVSFFPRWYSDRYL